MALVLLIGLVSTATAGDQHRNENKAETKELTWKANFSGSIINTQSDTNKDGVTGAMNSGGFNSTFGSGTAQSVAEPVLSGSGTCPNGHAGLIATVLPGTGHSIYRFDSTGDLLFNEFSSTLCVDLDTSIQFYSWEDTITGGTGRFAGATGSNSGSGTAKVLYDDGAGNFFAEFTSSLKGTIIVPANGGQGHDTED
jgi:hypothetical protein